VTRVQRRVRDQIAGAIEHDLERGESLMKECFEEMHGETSKETDANFEACYAEMRAIVAWLRRDHGATVTKSMDAPGMRFERPGGEP
jgi:hypothetical protein